MSEGFDFEYVGSPDIPPGVTAPEHLLSRAPQPAGWLAPLRFIRHHLRMRDRAAGRPAAISVNGKELG